MSEEHIATKGNEEISLKRFKLSCVVGQGAFGKVKIITEKKTKKEYALKYINKIQCIEQNALDLMFRERKLLQQFSHQNIIGLRFAFQDDEFLFLGLELAKGGDLRFSMTSRRAQLDDLTLAVYMAEMGSAVNYMHSMSIIHRDLKPENVLLDSDGHIYLTDLNLSISIEKKWPSSKTGTLDYMAPEMLIKQPYGYSVDWWAIGTILYELIYYQLPFGGSDDTKETIERIKTKPLHISTKPEFGPPNASRNALISGLLSRDVPSRICSSNDGRGFNVDIKSHPFMKSIDWDLVAKKKMEPLWRPKVYLFDQSDHNAHNFSPNLMLGELLGADEVLSYRARKKVGTSTKKSFASKVTSSISNFFHSTNSTAGSKSFEPKPKSSQESNLEVMDLYWTDYDYQEPDLCHFDLPPEKEHVKLSAQNSIAKFVVDDASQCGPDPCPLVEKNIPVFVIQSPDLKQRPSADRSKIKVQSFRTDHAKLGLETQRRSPLHEAIPFSPEILDSDSDSNK